MRKYLYIIVIAIIVLVNILAQYCYFRIDLTQDKRYSLSQPTKEMMKSLDSEVTITLYLDGALTPEYARLQTAVKDLAQELKQYGKVQLQLSNPLLFNEKDLQLFNEQLAEKGWTAIIESEQMRDGSLHQMQLYPYAKITYNNKSTLVSLLSIEGLETSLAQLEYNIADAVNILAQKNRKKIVFIEGHSELPEAYTYSCQEALAKYFDIYRGQMTADGDCLDQFAAVIIANPMEQFNDNEKYILDQYIMHGGNVLWLLSGVRLSKDMLTQDGFTPIIPLDVNLSDLLFNYGVRINARLVQDLQCVSVPMDMSPNPAQPQYQPIPWPYQPILQTPDSATIIPMRMFVTAPFVSDITFVGDTINQKYQELLTTSTASRYLPAPAEINLQYIDVDPAHFPKSKLPIAMLVEGKFKSFYTFLGKPDGVIDSRPTLKETNTAKQIIIACGGLIYNDLERGKPLPCGYDRYSRQQFDNADFIVTAVQYLTGNNHLHRKTIPVRFLNKVAVKEKLNNYTTLVIALPLAVLLLTFLTFFITRKIKYTV